MLTDLKVRRERGAEVNIFNLPQTEYRRNGYSVLNELP